MSGYDRTGAWLGTRRAVAVLLLRWGVAWGCSSGTIAGSCFSSGSALLRQALDGLVGERVTELVDDDTRNVQGEAPRQRKLHDAHVVLAHTVAQ